MNNKKMFVVYIKQQEKKERLYFKATSIMDLCGYIWFETRYEVSQIKELKRIYRKKDSFVEV